MPAFRNILSILVNNLAEWIYPLLLTMRLFKIFVSGLVGLLSLSPALAVRATRLLLEALKVLRAAAEKLILSSGFVRSLGFNGTFFICFSLAVFSNCWSISEASLDRAVPHARQLFVGLHFSFLCRPQVPVEWKPDIGLSVEGFFAAKGCLPRCCPS